MRKVELKTLSETELSRILAAIIFVSVEKSYT